MLQKLLDSNKHFSIIIENVAKDNNNVYRIDALIKKDNQFKDKLMIVLEFEDSTRLPEFRTIVPPRREFHNLSIEEIEEFLENII